MLSQIAEQGLDYLLELVRILIDNTMEAERPTVGPSTIKFQVSNILTKLGVSNRNEAVTLALRHGLVT
jgi:NarL family two-component system response regulator LiaR